MRPRLLQNHTVSPIIVGAGFIALDVIVTENSPDEPSLSTGGTCGNILSILSYLGWSSIAVNRLEKDFAGDHVFRDLRRWGVKLSFANLSPRAATPIVIQRNITTQTGKSHRFVWTCPHCGAWLPRYRPITRESVSAIQAKLRKVQVQVFFTDRVSPALVEMAQYFESTGAIVYFEPSSVGDEKLFRRMLDISHIVKYSEERMGHYDWTRGTSPLLLQIETLGRDGIRFKSRLPQAENSEWQHFDAFEPDHFEDSSGAGDWFSAALLYSIGVNGLRGLRQVTPPVLNQSLRFAQSLAAWNCGFPGARGLMYALRREEFLEGLQRVLNGKSLQKPILDDVDRSLRNKLASLCPSCVQPASRRASRKASNRAERLGTRARSTRS